MGLVEDEGLWSYASGGRADGRTLAARIGDRDRSRFVGREGQLEFLERCLGEDPPASVIFVHGPGGIGKSTLLRELARRAHMKGQETFFVEGRDLPPMPDALEAVLSGARESARPLILIDTYERMAALDGYLRRGLLPSLPGTTVVVIAGRAEPDPGWFTGGWEGIAVEFELERLDAGESLALLAAHGFDDDRAPTVVEWAEGSPLALALAADTAESDSDWVPAEGAEKPEMVRSLIRRLVDAELQGARLSALGVAAIARVTTVELLGAVLPESDAGAAYERLRSFTFTEPLGDGLTLHELVRRALRADLRRRDQERERELRRRIVDHLYEKARLGDPLLAIDMAHLVENPSIKWGWGWEGSVEYRLDDVRSGDAEQVAAHLEQRGFAAWWRLTRRFFNDAPERVAIARDSHDNMCGYLVCLTQSTAPEFAHEDPLVGPWLAHARSYAPLGESVMWHDSIDFTGDRRGRLQAMLGIGGILRSGAVNPRFAYLPISPTNPNALAFARMLGAEHLTELDLEIGPRRIECHRIDYGPGGLIALQRAVVYAELGLAPPAPAVEEPPLDLDSVREALRNFRVPHELARSPLGSGGSPEARAESVRSLVRDAAEHAFGDNENEKLLRRVLIRGYIEPAPSHEQAAIDLSLSRAAYFRRLRTAAERVAEYLAARA
jgi:AAA ATPase domain